jgi:hypothetical protein
MLLSMARQVHYSAHYLSLWAKQRVIKLGSPAMQVIKIPFVVSPSLNSGEPCRTTFTLRLFDKLTATSSQLSANGFVIILLTVGYIKKSTEITSYRDLVL